MAALGRLRAAVFQPRMMQVRHRKSMDVRKPKPAPLLRRLITEITAPLEVKTVTPLVERCQNWNQERASNADLLNRYEEFILNHTRNVIKNCRMLMVFQYLPMTANERKMVKIELAQNDFRLLPVQNKIMRRAIAGTRMVNLEPLMIAFNYYVVSESTDVALLLKCIQTMPKMILLGGMVENHILTKEGILACSKIPSLDHARGELLTVLGSKMSETRRLLGHHQSKLSTNLTQLVKQNTIGEEEK